MLVVPSPDYLGDKRLNAKEALLKTYADTDRRLEKYRLSDHNELTKVEKRLGTRMSHTELITKLRKLNPNLHFEDSMNWPNGVGVYYKDHEGNKKYAGTGFEKGYLPEYSYILTDAADLPTKEVRGWRTVVMRLLKAELLSWRQVVRVFGDP